MYEPPRVRVRRCRSTSKEGPGVEDHPRLGARSIRSKPSRTSSTTHSTRASLPPHAAKLSCSLTGPPPASVAWIGLLPGPDLVLPAKPASCGNGLPIVLGQGRSPPTRVLPDWRESGQSGGTCRVSALTRPLRCRNPCAARLRGWPLRSRGASGRAVGGSFGSSRSCAPAPGARGDEPRPGSCPNRP